MNSDGTQDINDTVFTRANSGQRIDWKDRTLGTPRASWANGVAPGADEIKITDGVSDLQIQVGTVYSWRENCCDINNLARGIRVTAGKWVPNGGLYPFTVKGGASDIGIYGVLEGHGTECDVDAGNLSDQSSAWVTNWELGLTPTDGTPISIRCLRAEMPRLVSGTGPYRVLFPDPRAWYHRLIVPIIMFAIKRGWL